MKSGLDAKPLFLQVDMLNKFIILYRTASLSSLARHKRCKHDEGQAGRKHVCELCGKGFFTPNSLKEHMFTHRFVKEWVGNSLSIFFSKYCIYAETS